MNIQDFVTTCSSWGLALSSAQIASFEAFHAALYEANEVKNLTRVPAEAAYSRHFLDSLLYQDLIPQNAKVLDIGTGPGFPAWPLACARPDLHLTAVDSNGKMLDFLRSQALINLEVVQVRVEEWGIREAFDVVTGRAVAPLSAQLEISATPAKVGGLVLPMRTLADDLDTFEPGVLGLQLEDVIQRNLPGEEATRLFPIYRKVKPTSQKYPRRWAELKRKPL